MPELSRNSSGKPQTPPDERVASVAAAQHGVVSGRQLVSLGIDENSIAYRVRVGRLHRVHRGVYAVGHDNLSGLGRFLAAVLAFGPGTVLSHFSAAAVWGFWKHRGDEVDVTLTRHVRSRPGIRAHHARTLDVTDTTLHARIPTTTPARTLLDLADVIRSDRALRRAVHEAEVQRRVSHHQLHAQLARAAGRRGAARLAAIVALGPAPTRSGLEDATLDLLHRHGFPRPQTNAILADVSGRPEVDFLFPDLRLVIEADGERYHGTPLARRADARKQAKIEAAGYRVVRLDESQVSGEEELTARRLWRAVEDQARAARPR